MLSGNSGAAHGRQLDAGIDHGLRRWCRAPAGRRSRASRKLVEVWAPPNENDTEAYARCVAEESGFGVDEPLDLHDYACLRPILVAMIRV